MTKDNTTIRPGDEIFLVICEDRHVDLMITAHTTLESANAEIDAFMRAYHSIQPCEWFERNYGRAQGWLRYVDAGDDAPRAYIEKSTLRGDV